MRSALLWTVCLGLAAGCSSASGGLGVGDVTSIPNGTGTGNAASGTYQVELDVTSCSGSCSVDGLALCSTGPAGSTTVIVVQSGGHLTAQSNGCSLVVSAFAGGINSDGTFDVGGATSNVDGSTSTVTSRATGSIAGKVLSATVETLAQGTADGSTIDCTQTLQVSGTRTGG